MSIQLSREVLSTFEDIKVFDTDPENGLTLLSYVNCDDNSNEIVKNSRGLVYVGDNLIMKAYSYTPEYTIDDKNLITNKLVKENYVFYDSHEGCLLRLFNYDGKWYNSTHKKLDSFKSRWSSKETFGEMFVKGLESIYNNPESELRKRLGDNIENVYLAFLSTLNPEYQYMFIVKNNTENRIVCNSESMIYHVGTFRVFTFELLFDVNICIPIPNRHYFKCVDELLNYVETVGHSYIQGVVILDEKGAVMKVLNKTYKELLSARGNQSSICFRYLQVRNVDKKNVEMLVYLYPEYKEKFQKYEEILYEVAKNIHFAYVKRFIKKQYVKLPKEEFEVMRLCHSWHLSDRESNKISFNKVLEELNNQPATRLNKMIKSYKNALKNPILNSQ